MNNCFRIILNRGESGECAHPCGLIPSPLSGVNFLTTSRRRDEFAVGIAEPPPFYGNTQDAKGELLLRYWRALPPELQCKILVLSESMAHIYPGFDKRADLARGRSDENATAEVG